MALRASDIANQIKAQIEAFRPSLEAVDVGTVMEVGDGIARISGLSGVMANELLEFPGGISGLALNLDVTTSAPSSWAIMPRSRKATRCAARGASSPCRWARPCWAVW